jgi:hypothetical protein
MQEKPRIEENYGSFVWGFGQDHKNEPRMQENLKLGDLKSGSYCNCM